MTTRARIGIGLALALLRLQVAHAETVNVPCDAEALGIAFAIANANAEEDDLWLAPSCLYATPATLVIAAGPPVNVYGRGATLSGGETHRVFDIPQGAALNLDQVTVSDGEAQDFGGGIWNKGALTLTRSAVTGNSAFFGGGILSTGSLRLVASSVSDNEASYGGGISNSGLLSLAGSAVTGNRAQNGGGISHGQGSSTLVNSTVSANYAFGNQGGGIYVISGAVTLDHVTVFNNSASMDGGGIYLLGGTLRLGNSILADGTGGDCVAAPGSVVVARGANLVETDACNVVGALSEDPWLGDLVGSPGYHPLSKKSPAVDAAAAASCPSVDQRGALRLGACDLGAFELTKAKKKGKK
jgi:hypothetical protein